MIRHVVRNDNSLVSVDLNGKIVVQDLNGKVISGYLSDEEFSILRFSKIISFSLQETNVTSQILNQIK